MIEDERTDTALGCGLCTAIFIFVIGGACLLYTMLHYSI